MLIFQIPGAGEVPNATVSVQMPQTVTMILPNQKMMSEFDRSDDLPVTWKGGALGETFQVYMEALPEKGVNPRGEILCSADASTGQLVIPGGLISQFPEIDTQGSISFQTQKQQEQVVDDWLFDLQAQAGATFNGEDASFQFDLH